MRILLSSLLLLATTLAESTDYYELLGVTKSATTQDIRKAYKKLALSLHPDKNQDDPNAQERFVKVTRAYEVLKDEAKRKQYDLYGDEDGPKVRTSYKSYDYYAHHFGLYDDDPNVVTLSGSDFESSIDLSNEGGSQWFIKFYSPMCGSCHTAAPAWTKLAAELTGAVYFGAVNCEDDFSICRQKARITSYPTYMLYPSGELLTGARNKEELRNFLLSRLATDLINVKSQKVWNEKKNTHDHWLLILSDHPGTKSDWLVLSSMLRGLLGVAVIHCNKELPCEELRAEESNADMIYLERRGESWSSKPLKGSEEPREVMMEVLELLPPIQTLTESSLMGYLKKLETGSEDPMLVHFHMGPNDALDTEIKKLTGLLNNFNIGRLNCARYSGFCNGMNVARYPQFIVFKAGGGREFYHGSHTVHGIAAFAKESSLAVNFKSVSPDELVQEIQQGAVLVDFYAPWCPPCLKLLPELRKASSFFSPSVVGFSSVDCTVHSQLCHQHSVTSYPTTMLFNSTRRPVKLGGRTASTIVEFVEDTITPRVIDLDEESFYIRLGQKSKNDIWLVGFFTHWCGPCQAMEPHYRKLAKMMADVPSVKIAQVNCEEQGRLCQQQNVPSYPHLRLYPSGSDGLRTVMIYSGYQRDAASLRMWLFNFIPSSVVELDPVKFRDLIKSGEHWLVDFFAPWCGHCVTFAPEFVTIAQKLEGRVKCGKMDCERYSSFCHSLGISGYPTVRFFTRGLPVEGFQINSQSSSVILDRVEQLLTSYSAHDEL
uniref:DnaJ homolog subfamily C member 10 n=1 Tax=Lygus hesperus TaxID=30085 RepID=A0A0A9WTW6_LYGHE